MNYGTILSIMPFVFVYCSCHYLPRLIDRKSSYSVTVTDANTAPKSGVDQKLVNPAVVRMQKWGITVDINHDNFARTVDNHRLDPPPTISAAFTQRAALTTGPTKLNGNTVPEIIAQASPAVNDVGRDMVTEANNLNFNDLGIQTSNDLLIPGFDSLKIVENSHHNVITTDKYFRNRIIITDTDQVNLGNSYSHSIAQRGINVADDSFLTDTIQNNPNRNIILSSPDQVSIGGHYGGDTQIRGNDADNFYFGDRTDVDPARSIAVADNVNKLQLSVSAHVSIPQKRLHTAQSVFRASDIIHDVHAVNDHYISTFLNPIDSYYNKAHQAGTVQRDMITVVVDT